MLYTTDDFSPELPLSYPRFGWENLLRSAAVTASGYSAPNEPDATQNPLTWDFWIPDALPATLTFTLSAAASIDYVGIAAHTIGHDGATVLLEYHDGADWVGIKTISPADDGQILILFNAVETDRLRLTVTGSSRPAIGVVYAGTMLVSERMIYQGHTPITLARQTTMRPQRSENGQWLGRSVVRRGAANNISITNLTAAWVRTYLQPFMNSAIRYPFFFAWRGSTFPAEVAYCWTDGDIQPTNSGPRDLMSVSFDVTALTGDEFSDISTP
jgi:hypothetical protein